MMLLIVSIAITALPMLYCLGMVGDTVNFDFPEHGVRGAFLILIYIAGIFGFFFQIGRAIAVWRGSVSKVITIGLIMGLCVYLFFMIPAIADLTHAGLALVISYTIPAVTILLSLRNIYIRRNQLKA